MKCSLCKERKIQELEDPDAEKILEDDDWITNGTSFNVNEDDLMDEDALLIEDPPPVGMISASEMIRQSPRLGMRTMAWREETWSQILGNPSMAPVRRGLRGRFVIIRRRHRARRRRVSQSL